MPAVLPVGLHWEVSFGPEGPAQVITNCPAVNEAVHTHRVVAAQAVEELLVAITAIVGKQHPARRKALRAAIVKSVHAAAGNSFMRGCHAEQARASFNRSGPRKAERDAEIAATVRMIERDRGVSRGEAAQILAADGFDGMTSDAIEKAVYRFNRRDKAAAK